ncbi:hypothetical protein LTR12_000432 [Friedmanniomyces endolithicus]|nr:hypothetical protein LTR12_000432 [Friedmanniomyces endolithicus]
MTLHLHLQLSERLRDTIITNNDKYAVKLTSRNFRLGTERLNPQMQASDMDEAGKTAFEHALDVFGHLISGLLRIVWDLPRQYREDFNINPDLSSFQILLLTIASVPGLVLVPVLGLLGFGRLGPIGGKLLMSLLGLATC